MSKLGDIDADLESADAYVESAGKKARQAKDKDGARKCDKQQENIKELRKDFSKKGGNENKKED